MVHYHRYHHQFCRKGQKHVEEDEESQVLMMECGGSGYFHKRARPKLLSLLIISLLSCSFILAPHLFFNSVSTFSLLCKLFSLMGSLIFLWFVLVFLCFLCFIWVLTCICGFCRFIWRPLCWYGCKYSSVFFSF